MTIQFKPGLKSGDLSLEVKSANHIETSSINQFRMANQSDEHLCLQMLLQAIPEMLRLLDQERAAE